MPVVTRFPVDALFHLFFEPVDYEVFQETQGSNVRRRAASLTVPQREVLEYLVTNVPIWDVDPATRRSRNGFAALNLRRLPNSLEELSVYLEDSPV